MLPGPQSGRELREVAREGNHQHQFGQLAGLEAQSHDVEVVPRPGPIDRSSQEVHAHQQEERDDVEPERAVVDPGQAKPAGADHGRDPQGEEERLFLQIDEYAPILADGNGNAGAVHHHHSDAQQEQRREQEPQIPPLRLFAHKFQLRQAHRPRSAHASRSDSAISATASLKTRPRSAMFTNISKLAHAGDSNTTPSGATAR